MGYGCLIVLILQECQSIENLYKSLVPAFPPPTTDPQMQDFTITLLPWSAENAQACLSLSLPFPEVPAPWSPEQVTSRMSHPHGGLGTTTSGWFKNNAGFVSEMPESQKERLLILFINLLTPKDKFVLFISLRWHQPEGQLK